MASVDGDSLFPAGGRLRRLGLSILRRRGGHELAEELLRRGGDSGDGALERVRVRLRRLREPLILLRPIVFYTTTVDARKGLWTFGKG